MAAKALALVAASAATAAAGGMTLPVRGVRSLERAGALVAGADDADALWLDPAGLARTPGDGEKSLLFDVAYVAQPVDYTPPGQATVSNLQPGQLVPTVAGALGIGDKLVIAGGIAGPMMATHRYDDTGPTRRASVSLAGTRLVTVAAGVAYAVTPELRVGATVQDLVSSLDWTLVANACPDAMVCAPDDHNFDLPMHVTQSDYISPSGSLGIQYDAAEGLTLGATLQAPAKVASTGTLAVTPPTAMTFTGMQVTGDHATTSFTLPPTVRAGVELRRDDVRVEAAVDVELWSLHDAITIAPDGVQLGARTLAPMTIARDYHTSIAVSLGGEYHVGLAQFGAGIAYETAAAPAGDVSVLTVDAPKWLAGIGGGWDADGWQLGGAAGFARLGDVDVTDPKVGELQPLHDASAPAFVNAGTYHAYYVVAGVRAARRFK
jgi:long-chain fatty acid transport protein